MGILKTIAASIGITICFFGLGCGVVAIPLAGAPSISQIFPQTIAVGSKSLTMKVVGTNFTNQAVILWNGSTLATSMVDANTLAGTIDSSSLAAPATVQLKVQNRQNGLESRSSPVIVVSPATIAPLLAISTTQLPSGSAGVSYNVSLAATGGTPAYTWSISSGQLPQGMSLAASTGTISGTPTVSGTFSLGVKVSDAGSPAQSATAALTMSVVAQRAVASLAISSVTLPGAAASQSYSGSLSASGGTGSYHWSITSGQLSSGLSIAALTGAISGTPTASGTSRFTVTVRDSGNPAQTASVPASIIVAGNVLTITSSALPSGAADTAYSRALQASGGTPAYTWSITSGSLPAGLSLAATTGVISGTPTASGTSSFSATVSDNTNPAQTQSAATSITVAAAQQPTGPGTTWYIRKDGGTRYSTGVTTGQCDGLADVAYPGSGTNQHCAFKDVRYLWQDGTYATGTTFPSWGWIGAGGDTYLIRGSLGTGATYRVGWNIGTGSYDSATSSFWGRAGDQGASGAPPPPSGTAAQHTRILGENYASCHSASAKTQLHGGWATGSVLSLRDASYVDVACLDITDFSACGRATQTVGCTSTQDYAQIGVTLSNTSTHDTLIDLHIHGMASEAISGPTGDGVVMDYVDMLGNASSGWNADPSDGTTGVGSLNVSHFNISWNGCAEEYPIVDPVPYGDCTDQSSGGYGDGFGTATVNSASPGWQVHFDQGTVSYNTQDGLDALHIGGTGSSMTDTRVLAYGNEGQQLKVGGATATIQNSVIVGNCEAMTTQAIPGTPSGFGSKLASPCRAGNTAVLINTTPGDPATFQDNTIYEAGAIGLEVEYATADKGPTNTLKYNNNVFVGFYNPGAQANATSIYSNTDLKMLTNPGASWANNVTYGQRSNWKCPAKGESNAICTDPGLADETYHAYGYGNMAPASGSSAVVGAGVSVPGIGIDYTGQARKNSPSIGAYE